MIDAGHPEQVDRLPDVLGRTLLPRVRDARQSQPAGGGEDPGEVARRVADLGRVQPDAKELVRVLGQFFQRPRRVGGTAVAQEARDQPGPRAGLIACTWPAARR
jgi:hypothetical protein